MNVRWGRFTGLAVAAGAAALVTLLGSPAMASTVFCGGGRGLTAQSAVSRAVWDAQVSAQAEGFFGACTLVGDPEIFETFNDPNFGHLFRAQVTVTCAS